MEDVLKSAYYKSPLGFKNVVWFVIEVMKIVKKMGFCFKNIKEDTIMTEDDEEDFKNIDVCRFCEKDIFSDKVSDHCYLTGKYRGPAHNKCSKNVTQHKSNINPFIFHNFSNYDCHVFFKKLLDKNNDKVKFDIKPETDEEYISVTYGCIRVIDSYRFLSSSLDSLVKTLVDNSHKTLENLKEEIVDNDEILDIVNEIEEEEDTTI